MSGMPILICMKYIIYQNMKDYNQKYFYDLLFREIYHWYQSNFIAIFAFQSVILNESQLL